MNLTQTRCSVCTAPLEIAADATHTRCSYCATAFAVERRGDKVSLQFADAIEGHAAQTRAVILEEADATQSELRRLQLTQQHSHTQLQLADVQREIRAVERAPQSSVARNQLAELQAQETDLKAQLAALELALNPESVGSTPLASDQPAIPIDWPELLFSFNGTIDRKQFWLGAIVFGLIFLVAAQIARFQDAAPGAREWLALPGFVLFALGVWIALAVAIKRLRDRRQSPLWLFVLFIPLIGPLWLLVQLGIMPSESI